MEARGGSRVERVGKRSARLPDFVEVVGLGQTSAPRPSGAQSKSWSGGVVERKDEKKTAVGRGTGVRPCASL